MVSGNRFIFDFSEVAELAVDFGRASARVLPEVDAVVKRGAQGVKDGLVADAERSKHFDVLASAISYDRLYGLNRVGYEVGPDKDRRGGALGNIAYFGGANGGGGTLDLDGPVRAEEPRLIVGLNTLKALGILEGR